MFTAPYFHNGFANNIEEVIQQHLNPYLYSKKYNDDGSFVITNDELQNISLISSIKLVLTDKEIFHLKQFLIALNDNGGLLKADLTPNNVPSGLLKFLDN